ncbi:hypothetical protein DDQ41_03920 [Streptomyces spongiicola]|uniref:Secreted protein n=1 Tax=Streptomyces spongiicola TaxID=1690221 RepID=A0ABM6V2S5_9ACTN|nr:hypothetical protein [Streptomyces spongiicola]AWK08223.1 hypothetical protein DDQ41_03920 [Streptomyces spongiicola]
MGGMRSARTARTARPTALLSAVATLLAALFFCLGQAGPGSGAALEHTAHRAEGGFAASSSPAAGTTRTDAPAVGLAAGTTRTDAPAVGLAAGTARTDAPADPATAYSCPYDRGDCGIYPHLGPAVLTAQPQDAPPAAAGLPRGSAADRLAGGPPHTGALPRAPDLHALQVQRT